MIAATQPVQSALRRGCDAWHLQLDKFSYLRGGDPSAKTESLKRVQDTYNQRSRSFLTDACKSFQRFADALHRQHGTRLADITLISESRVLLHLGRASVLENVGLHADRTTGLPLIPGTALKGVLSTWACWEVNQNPDGSFQPVEKFITRRSQFPRDIVRRIFGDDTESGSEHAGEIVFVGGFPKLPPTLGLDIVNPHHEASGKPKDNLTPNVFLCVEPGTEWRFLFYVRPGATEADQLLQTTSTWLIEALTQIGIGAKTAAGYGRFRIPTQTDRAAQEKAEADLRKAEAERAEEARRRAQQAELAAAAQAALASDYPNPATFKSRVLDRLNPGRIAQLESEIPILRKPENAAQLNQLKQLLATRDYRDIRRLLRTKEWFPKEWLPPQ